MLRNKQKIRKDRDDKYEKGFWIAESTCRSGLSAEILIYSHYVTVDKYDLPPDNCP